MAKKEEPQKFFFYNHHHQQQQFVAAAADHHPDHRHLEFISTNISSFSYTNSSHFDRISNIEIIDNQGSDIFRNYNFINNHIIFVIGIVMLFIFAIVVIIACKCKPWRLFLPSASAPRPRLIKADDIERPLVSEDSSPIHSQSNNFSRVNDIDGPGNQSQGRFSSDGVHGLGLILKQPSISPQLKHSDSFVLDIPDGSEDALVGQTLRRPLVTSQFFEEQRHEIEGINYSSRFDIDEQNVRESVPTYPGVQRSILLLEVVSGPSQGLRHSIQSTDTSRLPLMLGRVSPSEVLVEDSEVSGKHAHINWNVNKLKWELVDMGSLNGTLLNSKAIQHPQIGSRRWGDPVELSDGDIITLGTTSKIIVKITSLTELSFPFGVGMTSDPMALRRGGRKLPMEDVCCYQWPLPGSDQFGLFVICDGHGGAGAATSVSKILPEMVAKILSDSYRKERVLAICDASDVLREAFSQTEACINHHYEGCTATVLLVWADGHANFYAQCANVGDSACIINIDGKQIKMTEDHRITSYSERLRIQATGKPLRDGETRLCGLNLARMLGDKFLKQQDSRFSSEPYTSEVVYISQASRAFALMASDGFWDVINAKKAAQLVEQFSEQIQEKSSKDEDNSAERTAKLLLEEARTLRTKDNTSIVFLDFNSTNTLYSSKLNP